MTEENAYKFFPAENMIVFKIMLKVKLYIHRKFIIGFFQFFFSIKFKR